jgi:hypothetical protein
MTRWTSILIAALSITVGVGSAGAATHVKTVATTTRITVSDLSTGLSGGTYSDVSQWKAVVRGKGAPSPTLKRGQVTFTFSIGSAVLAKFTGSAAHPAECTFNSTITATGEILKAATPDVCSGGIAGDVSITSAQMSSPRIAVRASYAGTAGWSKSSSGPVNPETIKSGASASA